MDASLENGRKDRTLFYIPQGFSYKKQYFNIEFNIVLLFYESN